MRKTIIVLFLLVSFFLSAKDFDLLYLTNSDGLSNSSVNHIFQDQEGLIWFGTWDGLNAYNGRDFKSFKPNWEDVNSISNNIIRDIIEENNHLLWITTDKGINRLDKKSHTFDRFFTEPSIRTILGEHSFCIAKNSYNHIFASVFEQGLYYFDNETKRFVRINLKITQRIKKVFFDSSDHLWLLSNEKQLYKVVFKKGNLATPVVEKTVQFEYLHNIDMVYCPIKNELWIQTLDYKLYQYRISDEVLTEYLPSNATNGKIKAMLYLKDHLLWGTQNGLFRLNLKTRKTEQLINNISVLSLFAGTQSIVWVGTDAKGVLQLLPLQDKFRVYTDKNTPSFSRDAIRTFCEDKSGKLWVGTKGSGIFGLQATSDAKHLVVKQHLSTQNGLLSDFVFTMIAGKGDELWMGTEGNAINGINYYHNQAIHTLDIAKLLKDKIYVTSVYALLFTDENTLWVGTSGTGMLKLEIDRSTNPYSVKAYKRYVYDQNQPTSLSNNIVYAIIQANEHSLWVGTRGGGVNWFDIDKERFDAYRFSNQNSDLISSDDILSLYKDKKGFLWLGTSMGLIKLLEIKNGKPIFVRYTEKDGVPNNTVHGILEDKNNHLWFSTNKGLAKLIQQKNNTRIVSYFQKDGLQDDEFSDGSFYESPSNHTFYFGGISGFNAFNPLELATNQYMPSLVLDRFYVDNIEKPMANFLKEKTGKESLEIPHTINSFSFKFIPIDYITGTKCEISYLLEGFQNDWIHLGTSNTLVFSNLPKGNFRLKVRCTNSDKIWSDQIYVLPITMLSPWWANKVAYICYCIVLILIAYRIYRATVNQLKIRNEMRMKELQKQKTEEVHQAKIRFFTNIVHEFSNSLTLIYAPSIQLLNNVANDYVNRKYVHTIKTNAERMQNLIQQLIDFRKAETGYLKLNIERVDVQELVTLVIDNFTDALEKKNITLSFTPTVIYWHTDWDCMEKIVFNLLSNAAKYTPTNGKIEINTETRNSLLYLQVKNYGVGIKVENRQRIFNLFEILNHFDSKTPKGIVTQNGIGLSLCKSIAEMLNGNIKVESDGETYTSFLVTVPESNFTDVSRTTSQFTNELEINSNLYRLEEAKSKNSSSSADDTKKGLILIIDDEPQIRELLSDILGKEYTVITAANGNEAMELLKVQMPILIVCDIIMPQMNGISFVKNMKSQEQTRHIPIILLSSKAAVENQIDGLEQGADAYLGKPFHPRHLEVLIKSVLKQHKAVLDFNESAYASLVQYEGKLIKKEDHELILNLSKLIMERLEDEDLSLDAIADEMSISKMQLYRKLKGLTDQTPTEFIRNIRLNHAERLLKSTNKTVQEIMYDCGFNNKAYFFREFAKKFNQTPKQFRTLNE
jgi:signal transduction histidine kinase/DNA-binding response OmpR family regulator/ligand-binding sensor domain-containing protein